MIKELVKKYLEIMGKKENQTQSGEKLIIAENYFDFKYDIKYRLLYFKSKNGVINSYYVAIIDDENLEDRVYEFDDFYNNIIMTDNGFLYWEWESYSSEILDCLKNYGILQINM